MVAARDSAYDPDRWWQSREGIKIFVHEFGGMIVAFWEMNRYSVQTSNSSLAGSGEPSATGSAHVFQARN